MNFIYKLGKNFWIYFLIMFSSAFVDNILKNAIIVYVLFNLKSIWGLSSESLAPISAGVFILPFLLFSSIAGQWCDQEDKRKIVIICKALELMIGISVLFLFPMESFFWLLICLFLLGVHSTFFGPAKYTIIKDIVEEENFVLATAWVEAGTFVSILLGTIGGSLLASFKVFNNYGVGFVMILCSSTALICSFLLPKFSKVEAKPYDFNPINTTLLILKQSKSLPELNTVIRQISWFFFIATFLVTMLPAMVKNDLKLDEHMVSWIYALFIIGVALGSLYYEKLSKNGINLKPMFSSMWAILGLLILMGVCLPFAATPHFFIPIMVILIFLALAMGVFSTPLYSLLQKLPPKEWRSQAVASNNIVNSIYMIAASMLQLLLYAFKATHAQMFFVLAFCWMWAKKEMLKAYAYEFYTHLTYAILRLRYRLVVQGFKGFPQNEPFIVVSNHVSFIDWAFICQAANLKLRFVVWYIYYRMPLLKQFFNSIGAIPIAGKKEDIEYFNNAFLIMNQALKNGEPLMYFAEGGITYNGEIDIFRFGLAEIIKRHEGKIKIIPCCLNGLWGSAFSRHPEGKSGWIKKIFSKRMVVLNFGEMIEVENNVDLDDLRRRVLDLKVDHL